MERWLIDSSLMQIYFKPKKFEYRGKSSIYALLGVTLFKKYVPTSGDAMMKIAGKNILTQAGVVQSTQLLGMRRKREIGSYVTGWA
jgi:hypothetical protein